MLEHWSRDQVLQFIPSPLLLSASLSSHLAIAGDVGVRDHGDLGQQDAALLLLVLLHKVLEPLPERVQEEEAQFPRLSRKTASAFCMKFERGSEGGDYPKLAENMHERQYVQMISTVISYTEDTYDLPKSL